MVLLTPEPAILAVTAILAVLAGLVIGFVPAKHSARNGVDNLYGGRSVARSLGQSGRLLLAAQVSLSMILMVWAGLFTSTLAQLRSNYTALHESSIIFTRLAQLPGDRRPVPATYAQTLVGELSSIPRVSSASLSAVFPAYLAFAGALPLDRYQRYEPNSSEISALTDFVSPGFFETYGISRLRGRDFRWTDGVGAPPVAVVSRSLAQKLFDKEDAVGQRLQMHSGNGVKDFEIIGIVADAPFGSIREPRLPTVFKSILQEPSRVASAMAHVRHGGSLNTVRDAYKIAVERQGYHFVRTPFSFHEFADSALLNERLIASISGLAGLLVVVLACIGLYSMLTHAVVSRVREIGIRSALGASRSDLVQMVVKDGLAVVIPGIGLGIVAALMSARVVSSLLYGVGASDLSTISMSALVFVSTSLIASVLPAISAAKIDPVEALRQD